MSPWCLIEVEAKSTGIGAATVSGVWSCRDWNTRFKIHYDYPLHLPTKRRRTITHCPAHKIDNYSLPLPTSHIARTLGTTSIRHRSDAFASNRCLIDIDPWVFPIWEDWRRLTAPAWTKHLQFSGDRGEGEVGRMAQYVTFSAARFPGKTKLTSINTSYYELFLRKYKKRICSL